MERLSVNICLRNLILSVLLVCFSSTCTATEGSFQLKEYFVEEAIFILNVKKHVDKIKDSEGKPADKAFEHLVKLKIEIENYFGVQLDTNYFIDQAVLECEKNDLYIDSAVVKKIKKRIKKIQKKQQKRWLGFEKCEYKKKKNKDKDQFELPPSLGYGLSLVCAGGFLMLIPIPLCQESGKWCISTGIGFIGSYIWLEHDKEDNQDDSEKTEEPMVWI